METSCDKVLVSRAARTQNSFFKKIEREAELEKGLFNIQPTTIVRPAARNICSNSKEF